MKTLSKLGFSLAMAGAVAAGISTTVIAGQSDIAESKATAKNIAQAKVSYQQAAQIAVNQVQNQPVVVSIEFDDDHGEQLWEVELLTTDGAEHEVKVSSDTGAVLSHEID